MALSAGSRDYKTFTRGLITELSELNFPLDASVDEDNCILDRDGSRTRRLGIDREASASLLNAETGTNALQNSSISWHEWENVEGSADRRFGVLQIGAKLYFHDLASDPITTLPFTVDLTTHMVGSSFSVESSRCDMVSAKGVLFVVSRAIIPLRIKYSSVTENVEVFETTLEVRDFEGVEDDLTIDEEPTNLTLKHEYNLRNQGWNPPGEDKFEPITVFQKAKGRYPGNNKQWHAGKLDADSADEATITAQGSSLGSVISHLVEVGSIKTEDVITSLKGTFDPNLLDNLSSGKTQAPRGHYLISPMERTLGERERISAILGLDDSDAGEIQVGQAPTGEETPNSLTKVLSHANALDGGTGDIHDEDAEHHDIHFLGTEADLSASCSIDTTIKRFGAGSVQKLRGAPGGESGLNIVRNSGNEWTELFNDQDCQLGMWIRLRNYTTTESAGIMSMFTRWSEASGFRGWAWEWWPAGASTTPTARDQGDSNNAGFVFESSPVGAAGSEYRILPSRFPYTIPLLKWVWVGLSWKQATREIQIFVKEEDGDLQQIGETQVVDTNSFPFAEDADNLFCGKRNSVGSQGSWDGWIDGIHVQEQREVYKIPGEPVPPVAPQCVESFAGRVCYGGGGESGMAGRVLMSPVLERHGQAGECHQMGDPTAEVNSELLDSDGVDIVIDNMGEVLRLYSLGSHLMVFADNGVWGIGGTDATGFKATGFEVTNLTADGIMGPGSLVDALGQPFWWGKAGIWTIQSREDGQQGLAVRNLSLETMQGFYDGNHRFTKIPSWSKAHAEGTYDEERKRAVWLFRTDDPGDDTGRHKYDRALVYDNQLQAFHPWTFRELASNTPYPVAAFSTPGKGAGTQEVSVFRDEDQLQDLATDDIVVNRQIVTGRDVLLKFVCIEPSILTAGLDLYTFCELNDTGYKDWTTVGAPGLEATAFAEAGYELGDSPGKMKWAPRILTFVRRGTNHDLTMQARWEWADAAASGKFTTAQSVYTSRNLDTDGTGGFPVIVSSKKIRGRGHALSVRYDSVIGKNFVLVGWSTEYGQNKRTS